MHQLQDKTVVKYFKNLAIGPDKPMQLVSATHFILYRIPTCNL